MVQTSTAPKNLWVAASDGDLDRVRVRFLHPPLYTTPPDQNSLDLSISSRTSISVPTQKTPIPTPPCALNSADAPITLWFTDEYRHAAASYDHLELLEYLISIGGDINISDDDGETPIFTVESLEMARWMVDHGADVQITNQEGLTVCRP